MPTYARKHDFGAILDPRVSQEWTLWAPFSVRKAPKGYDPELREPSWSRPGRDLAPKTLQERIFIDLGVDFWSMLEGF